MTGRPKSLAINLKDIYKVYQNYIPNKLDYKSFSRVLKTLNKESFKIIIMESDEFIMPFKLGFIRVTKKPTFSGACSPTHVRYIPKDWAEIKRTGKLAFLFNEHRNGYKYSFKWSRDRGHHNIRSFKFIACRRNKRMLAHVLKTMPEIDYMSTTHPQKTKIVPEIAF